MKNKLIKKNIYSDYIVIFSDKFIENVSNKDVIILENKIKNFLLLLEINCKNFSNLLFRKNFKKTSFEISDSDIGIKKNALGYVIVSATNKLYLKTFNVVNHELLHLSSSKPLVKDELFYPFDEAYTLLLAERYFNEKITGINSIDVVILKNIESIIGRDVMETKYFKGKLYSTIKHLYKYESKENIATLLLCISKLYELKLSPNKDNIVEEIQNYTSKAFDILYSCLKNKISTLRTTQEIDYLISQGEWSGVKNYNFYNSSNDYKINLLNKDDINVLKKKKIINR